MQTSAILISGSAWRKSMSDKVSGSFSNILDNLSKTWPIVLTLCGCIVYCVTLNNQVTDLHAQISDMKAQNLTSRVTILEDEQRNDASNMASQIANLQSNFQSLQAEQHEQSSTLEGISQETAAIEAQLGFLIKQYKPDAP